MKRLLFIAPLAALIAGPGHAQSGRTVTVDRPNYEGTRTIARDGQGAISRDTAVTRKSDGATASRDYDRIVTADGWSASGSATGFAGRTRGFDAAHSHGNGGATTTATATGRRGGTINYAGAWARTDTGHSRSRSLTAGAGTSLHARNVDVSRANGQVSHSATTSRAVGFHPRARGFRRR